jgi:hypothetical protein
MYATYNGLRNKKFPSRNKNVETEIRKFIRQCVGMLYWIKKIQFSLSKGIFVQSMRFFANFKEKQRWRQFLSMIFGLLLGEPL